MQIEIIKKEWDASYIPLRKMFIYDGNLFLRIEDHLNLFFGNTHIFQVFDNAFTDQSKYTEVKLPWLFTSDDIEYEVTEYSDFFIHVHENVYIAGKSVDRSQGASIYFEYKDKVYTINGQECVLCPDSSLFVNRIPISITSMKVNEV